VGSGEAETQHAASLRFSERGWWGRSGPGSKIKAVASAEPEPKPRPEPELDFHLPQEEPSGTWKWIALGVVVVAVVIGVMAWSGLKNRPQGGGSVPEAPYANNLPIADLQLSQSDSFVGTVTYISGTIANTGAKTVNGITLEIVFRNSLGEVVQREQQSPLVMHSVGITNDYVDLSQAPLTPNARDQFRLTFEHISADWNQGYPELRVVDVTFEK
jgi:hypothetical protein